jgi:malonyl-CoA O-methyltransferase
LTRKQRIGRAFGQAAATYDAHATVQKIAAERLAELIAEEPAARVLEIGCGTGFLTSALARRLPHAEVIATDLAPAMLRACRNRVPAARYLAMDGERPCFAPGSFDLVCAGLAVQWFDDAQAALSNLCRLLRPGGRLAVSTLLSDSLAEWRQAHTLEGLDAGAPHFAAAADLQHFSYEGAAMTLTQDRVVVRYPDGRAFVHAIKAIGAGTPRPGQRALTHRQFKTVVRRFESAGSSATYHLGYGMLRHD